MTVTPTELRRWLTGKFLTDVWEVCAIYNGSITSGIRSDAHNAFVGGHAQSRHRYASGWGLACDVWLDNPDDRPAAKVEMANRGWYTYVGDDYAPNRIHFQAFQAGKPLPTLEV